MCFFDASHTFLEKEKEHKSIVLGTIQRSTTKQQQQHVRIVADSGGVLEKVLPCQFQVLHEGTNDEGCFYNPRQELVYQEGSTLREVRVGDLVFCAFQKGVENSHYYRGRIAALHFPNKTRTTTSTTDGTTSSLPLVDVAYDDNDYERYVPCQYLRWCESGPRTYLEWMLGFPLTYQNRTCVVVVGSSNGTIQEDDDDPLLTVQVVHEHTASSSPQYYTVPYHQVAPLVFAEQVHRRTHGESDVPIRIVDWPDSDSSSPEPPGKKRKKSQASVRTRNVAEVHAVLEPPPQDANHEDPEESPTTTSFDKRYNDLLPGEAITLEKALDSPESATGLLMLQHAWGCGKVPNAGLWYNLLQLAVHGPHRQGVDFPDPARLDRLQHFLSMAWDTNGQEFLKQACHSIYTQSASDHAASSRAYEWFHEALRRLDECMYYVEEDEYTSEHVPVLLRYWQSLHAKYHAAWTLRKLLSYQMQDLNVGKSHQDFAEFVAQRPILNELHQHRRGSKHAFQSAIRALIRHEIQLTRFSFPQKVQMPLHLLKSFLDVSKNLSSELGSLVSLLAKFYSIESSENTKALVYLIKETVNDSISKSTFDHNMVVDDEHRDYFVHVKLNTVLDLDPTVPQLRPGLSDALGVSFYYNMIYEL